MQRFDRDNLPGDPAGWSEFVKREPTRAVRVDGPFEVDMGDGQVVTCQDGYVAMDVRHIPFPVPAAEFERIYEPIN